MLVYIKTYISTGNVLIIKNIDKICTLLNKSTWLIIQFKLSKCGTFTLVTHNSPDWVYLDEDVCYIIKK